MKSRTRVPPREGANGPGAVLDDASLLRACAAGDLSGWREVVDRYARLVYSIPRTYGLPEDVCDDVSQVVFQTLFRRVGRLGEVRSLAAWLARVAHRECWRQGRALRRRPGEVVADVPMKDPTPALLEDWDRRYRVDRALRDLGGRCEELLRLLFLEPSRPSYQSVAERLGVPVGSIGAWRGRCLRKLLDLFRTDAEAGTDP